jgi:hypothetical protein
MSKKGKKTKATPGPAAEDLTGRTFVFLKVQEFSRRGADGHYYWWCECRCTPGRRLPHDIPGKRLRNGRTKSCGCWRRNPEVRRAAAMAMSVKARLARAKSGAQGRWRRTRRKVKGFRNTPPCRNE